MATDQISSVEFHKRLHHSRAKFMNIGASGSEITHQGANAIREGPEIFSEAAVGAADNRILREAFKNGIAGSGGPVKVVKVQSLMAFESLHERRATGIVNTSGTTVTA